MSGPYRFGEEEARKSLKVFGWSIASAFVALGLSLVGALDLPADYAFVVPIINSVLYAAHQFIKNNATV
jgi:hypothetical protein